MRLCALFISGFATGAGVVWVYVLSLKATIRTYETYVHDRMQAAWRESAPPKTPMNSRRPSAP